MQSLFALFVITLLVTSSAAADDDHCGLCVDLMGQAINQLLNYILNVGVVGTCGELCSKLPEKLEATACDLICDIVGIEGFVDAIKHADLDPIYFCIDIDLCEGQKGGEIQIIDAMVQPKTGPQGTEFQLEMQYKVIKATGTGSMVVQISSEGQPPVGSSNLLLPQAAGVTQDVTMTLKTQPSEQMSWNPGTYHVGWGIATGGSFGSKHAKILAENTASSFEITQ